MECTINASEAAARALEDIRTGRHRIVFGKRAEAPENTRPSRLKHLVFSITVVLPLLWMFASPRNNHVSGIVTKKSVPLANASMVFRSSRGVNHPCESDDEGKFNVRLPDGKYRIYMVEGQKKTLSPTTLNCFENTSMDVFFN